MVLLSFLVIAVREKKKIHFDLPFLLFFLFFIWGALSAFWSVNLDLTLFRLISILQLLLVYFILSNQARNEEAIDRIMRFLFAGAIGYVIFGVSDLVLLLSRNENQRLASIAKNANWFFMVSICLIPACYWALAVVRNKAVKILAVLTLLALLILSLYTQSRGGLVSLAVFFLTYLLLSRRKFSWLLLIVISALLVYQAMPEGYLERFEDLSTSLRIVELWPAGVRAFEQNMFAGHGLGTSHFVVTRYLPRTPFVGEYFSVHNSLLAVAIDLGAPGVGLYLLFVAVPTLALFRVIRRSRARQHRSPLVTLAEITVCVLMAYMATWIKGGGIEYQKMLWVLVGLETCLAQAIGFQLAVSASAVAEASPAFKGRRHAY